jgi:hypothetical protein
MLFLTDWKTSLNFCSRKKMGQFLFKKKRFWPLVFRRKSSNRRRNCGGTAGHFCGKSGTFQLTPPNQTATRVTVQQANIAVSQLPQKNKNGSFSLPGRASLPVNATDLQRDDPANNKIQAILDHVIGTRVELLSKIEKALLEKNYTVCPFVGSSEPVQLEANFPTMHEHSQKWTLNAKHHLAFVLIAASLLKHISEANRPDKGNLATQMSRMSTCIDVLLRNILPPSGQLNLFLSESGGTGKSRIIQAIVDFARRWHTIASHVICASSGVAAILIGGCTLHTALGIGISMNPSDPSNNHIEAWSEVSCSWTSSA